MSDLETRLDELLIENLRRRQQRRRLLLFVGAASVVAGVVVLAVSLSAQEAEGLLRDLPIELLALVGAGLGTSGFVLMLGHWFDGGARRYREMRNDVDVHLQKTRLEVSPSSLPGDPISFVRAWGDFEDCATEALDRRGTEFDRLSVASLLRALGESGIVDQEDVGRLRLMLRLRNAIVRSAPQDVPTKAVAYLAGMRVRLAA